MFALVLVLQKLRALLTLLNISVDDIFLVVLKLFLLANYEFCPLRDIFNFSSTELSNI